MIWPLMMGGEKRLLKGIVDGTWYINRPIPQHDADCIRDAVMTKRQLKNFAPLLLKRDRNISTKMQEEIINIHSKENIKYSDACSRR